MASPTPEQLVNILRRPLDALPDPLELVPVPGPFDVTIRPPGSKSLMNRAVLLAALAEGRSEIEHPLLDAQDAQVMIRALEQLGARFEMPRGDDEPLIIHGTGGRLKGGCELHLENAGTATRFLSAVACLADGPVVIDGSERMRQRPIGELIALLRELGVTIDELGEPGCVPLRVHPHRPAGGEIEIGATQSSQYISALMMIAPLMEQGLTIQFTEEPTSASYIHMTEWVMKWFTTAKSSLDTQPVRVDAGALQGNVWNLEPDASGAAYPLIAGSIGQEGSRVRVPGLNHYSQQPDIEFRLHLPGICTESDDLDDMVCTPLPCWPPTADGKDSNLTLCPDLGPTIAAIRTFYLGTTTIRGLRTLRVKETDRIAAIENELAKIGVNVESFTYTNEHGQLDEGITITPPPCGIDCSPDAPPVVFDTYDDHRMAMSLALIGLRRPNVAIRDPACVAKTYPTFWWHWSLLYESALAGGKPRGPNVE